MKSFAAHVTPRSERFTWDSAELEHHFPPQGMADPVFRRRVDEDFRLKDRHGAYEHLKGLPDGGHLDEVSHRFTMAEMEHHRFHHDNMAYGAKDHLRRYKEDSNEYNSSLRNAPKVGHGLAIIDDLGSHHYSRSRIKMIGHMEEVTGNPTSHSMTLYRGFSRAHPGHLQPGQQFIDHGFTGMTPNLQVASGFSENTKTWKDTKKTNDAGVAVGTKGMAMIHVPKGTRAHYLDVRGDNEMSDEQEVTLHRGTRFQVTGHSLHPHPFWSDQQLHVVHMRVMGQHPLPLINPHPEE